jgi:mannosyltransferase OCH1-like enzyme
MNMSDKNKIPRIIHQTWKDYNVPEHWVKAVESCKSIHRHYKYVHWTDADMDEFVQAIYPDFYPTYKNYKYHIQRCDAFRYLILYRYGGIYIDMDIICRKKLDDLLHYDIVFSRSSNISSCVTNSFMMCIPNHPFMKYVIDHLKLYQESYASFGKHWHVMNSTGPVYLKKMVDTYISKMRHEIPRCYFLTQAEFAGDCNACSEKICLGGTYFSHVKGHSWHEADSVIYNMLMCNKRSSLTILFLIIIGLIIYIVVVEKNIRFNMAT